ncbi:MAG: hypothetical protein WD055_05070 [Candidatus Dependentiae bacterium]
MNLHHKLLLIALLMPVMHIHTEKPGAEVLQLKPNISAKTALLTAGSGIGAGSATLYALSWLLGISYRHTLNVNHPEIVSSLITAASIATGSLAAWFAYRNLPEGKYGTAHKALSQAINDEVLNELIDLQQNLIENIKNEYIEFTYPRVTAYNDFINYRKALHNATTLFREAIINSDDNLLVNMAHECIETTNAYLKEIDTCINIIRSEPDWIEQLKGHDTMLARQAQERAALAQQQVAFNTAFNRTVVIH